MTRRTASKKVPSDKQHPADIPIWGRLAASISIFIITLAVFSPALRLGFVDWDDDVLILQNPDMWGFSLAHLKWMFTTTFMGHYQPLTWVSLALNYESGKLNPFGYHMGNILLHAGSAVLIFALTLMIFRRTLTGISAGGRAAGAMLAALIFAVHPLRVESVAWVTERRDVLSGFFLIGAVVCYVQYTCGTLARRWWYAASVLLLVCSLMSKVWGLTLPVVLLVLDVYPLKRVDPSAKGRSILNLLKEKILFIVPAAAAAGMAMYAQLATVGKYAPRSLFYRIMQAFYALTFYVSKTILPTNLSPVYEHPDTLGATSLRFIAPVIFVVGITIALLIHRRRLPSLLTAWIIYVIIVSPVLGIAQTWPLFVADRYSYIACIPFAIVTAAGFALLAGKLSRSGAQAVPAVLGVAVVIALIVRTRSQLEVWRDTESLWSAALRHDPNSQTALLGMGVLCSNRRQGDAAINYLRRAHERSPDSSQVTVNLAGAYALAGDRQRSLELYRKATTQPSLSVNDMLNIGIGFAALGQYDEAQSAYRMLLTESPNDGEAHFRLAEALDAAGRRDDAIFEYERSLNLLEPLVRTGLADPDVNMEAYLFQQTCTRIIESLIRKGDAASAAKYKEKLGLLGKS